MGATLAGSPDAYIATTTEGGRFRNTEVLTVRGSQVVEVEV